MSKKRLRSHSNDRIGSSRLTMFDEFVMMDGCKRKLGYRRKLYSCQLVFEIETVPPSPCHILLCLCITYRFYLERKICGVHFVKRKVCDHGVVCGALSTNFVPMTVPVRCIMN